MKESLPLAEFKNQQDSDWRTEALFEALINHVDLGITLISPDFEIIGANTKQGQMLKKPVCEFVGKKCFQEFEKRDSICPHCPGVEAMATGRKTKAETVGILDDGSEIPVKIIALPIINSEGTCTGFVEIVEDISERKQAEEQARLLSLITEQVSDAVVATDLDYKIIYVNQAFERLYGYSREEVLGFSPKILNQGEPAESIQQEVSERVSAGKVWLGELDCCRKDGSFFRCELTVFPLFDDQGEVFAHAGIQRDISKRKQTEEELSKYRDHLEDLVRRRTEELVKSKEKLIRSERLASVGTLAAGIAHEINNPLGLIMLSAQRALEQGENTKAAEKSFLEITDNVKRCGSIVKSVLQFSRDQPTEKWELSLDKVIRQAMNLTGEYARCHGINLRYEPAKELSQILGNDVELEQVFVNLLNNAAQASREGQEILVQKKNTAKTVQVIVRDHGKGMSEEEIQHAFDPFYTKRKKEGGSGLGLSLSHGIITDHGGKIEIESKPGMGTAITVELPVIIPGKK